MHLDLAASFQEKAPFLGSAHQILHSIQKNSPFLGSIRHLQSPILIQVPFQGLPTILPPDTTEWLLQEIANINAVFFAEITRMIFTYTLDTQ